jgi:hypothetical protein
MAVRAFTDKPEALVDSDAKCNPVDSIGSSTKSRLPIPNAGLLLGFQGTKTALREGISSAFSDAGGCTSPRNSGLLSALKKAIAEDVIETWRIDSDGDLTHTASQWTGRAWMRPRVLEDRLLFNIVASKKENMSKTLYGVYHGRLHPDPIDPFRRQVEDCQRDRVGHAGRLDLTPVLKPTTAVRRLC